jgi:ribonucleotide reductase beta subunit family protein with ferritin-like domain
MKTVTKKAVNAFLNGKNFKSGNTKVYNFLGQTILELHGNEIAYINKDGIISITNRGWFSNTTKERLNALPNVNIYQRNFVWYLNGKAWDGNLIEI